MFDEFRLSENARGTRTPLVDTPWPLRVLGLGAPFAQLQQLTIFAAQGVFHPLGYVPGPFSAVEELVLCQLLLFSYPPSHTMPVSSALKLLHTAQLGERNRRQIVTMSHHYASDAENGGATRMTSEGNVADNCCAASCVDLTTKKGKRNPCLPVKLYFARNTILLVVGSFKGMGRNSVSPFSLHFTNDKFRAVPV
ncbi:hypothetical protein H4582DRAFT_2055721 [Lactarius indigo]|nr:hypothetical protein H4582DRAFT_2055721 [Lactarius indigo]